MFAGWASPGPVLLLEESVPRRDQRHWGGRTAERSPRSGVAALSLPAPLPLGMVSGGPRHPGLILAPVSWAGGARALQGQPRWLSCTSGTGWRSEHHVKAQRSGLSWVCLGWGTASLFRCPCYTLHPECPSAPPPSHTLFLTKLSGSCPEPARTPPPSTLQPCSLLSLEPLGTQQLCDMSHLYFVPNETKSFTEHSWSAGSGRAFKYFI